MSRLSHSEIHMVHRIGWLRAAVLGANDGLVSTASLVVGVTAAGSGKSEVLIARLAGLVAGAMSIAVGEDVLISSQTDAERAALARETRELAETQEGRARGAHADLRKPGAGSRPYGKGGPPADRTGRARIARARRSRHLRDCHGTPDPGGAGLGLHIRRGRDRCADRRSIGARNVKRAVRGDLGDRRPRGPRQSGRLRRRRWCRSARCAGHPLGRPCNGCDSSGGGAVWRNGWVEISGFWVEKVSFPAYPPATPLQAWSSVRLFRDIRGIARQLIEMRSNGTTSNRVVMLPIRLTPTVPERGRGGRFRRRTHF